MRNAAVPLNACLAGVILTSGVVQRAPATRISDIPSLSPFGLAATAALLLLLGSAALRLSRRRSG